MAQNGERKVRMLIDDPDVQGGVNVVYVPASEVKQKQLEFKKYNIRIDDRSLPRMTRITKGALDLAPTGLSMAGDILGGIGAGTLSSGAATVSTPETLGASWAVVPPAVMAGRVAGGGLGAGVGQAIKEFGYGAMGFGDAPGTVANEALYGSLGSAIGIPAEAAINKTVAPFLTKMAVGFKNPHATEAVINNILKNRYIVKTKGAVEAAGRELEKLAAERLSVLREAAQKGGTASYQKVVDAIEGIVEDLSLHGEGEKAKSLLRRIETYKKVLQKSGNNWREVMRSSIAPLEEAQKYVTKANTILADYYSQKKTGSVSKEALPAGKRFMLEAADNLRNQLREAVDAALQKAPGFYQKINENLGIAQGTRDALQVAQAAPRFTGGAQSVAGAGLAAGGAAAALSGGGSKAGTAASTAGLLALFPELASAIAPRARYAARLSTPTIETIRALASRNGRQGFGNVPAGPFYAPADETQVPR